MLEIHGLGGEDRTGLETGGQVKSSAEERGQQSGRCRRGAVPQKDQDKEVASLVGWRKSAERRGQRSGVVVGRQQSERLRGGC